MAISFNTIPADIRAPGQYTEVDSSRALQGLSPRPNVALIISQRLSTGSVAAETPARILSASDAETKFGTGSLLAHMVRTFKKANPYVELWGIALDDEGAGVQATGTIALTGPATAAGSVYLYVAGERIPVAVASGDANTAIGTAIVAAVNARAHLPVTASGTSTVTFTCRHKGTAGNAFDIRLNYYDGEALPAGVGAVVTGMASGATDPDMADAVASMGDVQYTTIATSLNDATNIAKLETELLRRWGPTVKADGHAFIGKCDTVGNTTTFCNARNSQFLTIQAGGESPTPHWVWAAAAAGADSAEPDPARPRQTLLLQDCLPPAKEDQWTWSERNVILSDGASTYLVGPDGRCYVERMITAYQKNAANTPDVTYLDITTMRTLSAIRYDVQTRIALRFPRHKLADDGIRVSPGQPISTPSIIRAELVALAYLWQDSGLIEDVEQFKKDLIVQRSTSDVNAIEAIIPPDLMNQFMVFRGQVQFIL